MGGRKAAKSTPGHPALRRGAWAAGGCAGLWWVLSGGDPHSWGVGAPSVVLASALALALSPPRPLRFRPLGLLPLLPFFLWESLRGGIDVARRALHPDLPLRPALLRYRTGLAEGAPRIFLVHCVSLLPGTLSAALEGDTLMVQVLDAGAPVEEELAALEARVGRLFASPLGPEQRDG